MDNNQFSRYRLLLYYSDDPEDPDENFCIKDSVRYTSLTDARRQMHRIIADEYRNLIALGMDTSSVEINTDSDRTASLALYDKDTVQPEITLAIEIVPCYFENIN